MFRKKVKNIEEIIFNEIINNTRGKTPPTINAIKTENGFSPEFLFSNATEEDIKKLKLKFNEWNNLNGNKFTLDIKKV